MPKRSQPVLTLTAAAKRINMADPQAAKRDAAQSKPWHAEAWGYFDEVPEIKESIRYRGNQLGKVRLFVAVANPDDPTADPVPVNDPDSGVPESVAAAATAELARLRSRMGGQAEIMRMLDMNLEVVGEAYLIGYAERAGTTVVDPVTNLPKLEGYQPEDWMIRSVSEVEIKGSGKSTKYKVLADPNDTKGVELTEDDTIMRIWLRHPQWASQADCAMRGLLGECRQLQVLCQQQLAHSYRALSAGILTVPNELMPVGPPDPTKPEEVEDPLMDVLYEVLTAPIADPTHPSTVQPGLLRGPSAQLGPDVLRLIKFYDAEQVKDIEARIEARIGRIARGLNLPVEKIMGHQCVDTETLIFTADGWKRYELVNVGDEVLTMDHRTGLASWQPVDAMNVFTLHDEPMVSIRGRSHDSLTTGNHRWPTISGRGKRRWRTTDTLMCHDRLTVGAPLADLPSEAKWSDALVEMVAWFWTEGTYCNGGSARIYQSETANPEKCASIRRTLTALFGPALDGAHASSRGRNICSFEDCGWPVHSHGLCNAHRFQEREGMVLRPVRRSSPKPDITVPFAAWTEGGTAGHHRFQLNRAAAEVLHSIAPGPDKVVERGFLRSLTQSQLDLFIATSVAGDGNLCANGSTSVLHQAHEGRAAAYEYACILAGRSVRTSQTENTTGFSNGVSHRWNVRASDPSPARVRNMDQTTVNYSGVVWCPTTANGTWLAKRNGTVYFTGNSTTYANASQVDEDEFNDYLAPSAETAVEALTFAFLTPQLEEAGGEAAAWADRLFIWYDPSDLIAQPDAEKHAAEAHDRNAISDAALRRAYGFGEDDAADPEELLIRAALKSGRLSADVTLALLEKLGIPLDVTPGAAGADANQPAVTASVVGRMLRPIRAASRPSSPDYGRRLTEIDRELRSRLLVASNVAMGTALDRAANRLRTKTNGSSMRASLQNVPRRSWFAQLGPSLVAEAMGEEDPLEGAWDGLEGEFRAWGADAQSRARTTAGQAVGADLSGLEPQQADDLDGAWAWFAAALTGLATAKLWTPDPSAPTIGEHDPSVMIPAGMVRQAVARAGGAQGLITGGQDAWVTLTDAGTRPAGGIGTGDLIRGALRDGGATIEGYVWQYGPGFRAKPFDPHERLNGTPFVNFDDDVLASQGEFGWSHYLPGDHSGCLCDVEPSIIGVDER